MPPSVRRTIAELYVECGLESLRTAEAVQICARAACALDGRDEVSLDDLRDVLPLVLGQRVEASVLERFLARVDHEVLHRPAAAATPGPAGAGTAQPDQSQAAASGETDILLADGRAGRGTSPTAGARRALDSEKDPAGSLLAADEGSGTRLGLDGLFSRLMAKVRGRPAMAGAPGGGSVGGTGHASTTGGAGSGDGGAGLDPATTPVLAPPERARALAEMPPEQALRLPDDAAGGRA
ncbi:MAG: hypothetical protein Q8P31_14100 [Bacillota bacterium]|nr:hypothetical protein [Bacillota bacterium]